MDAVSLLHTQLVRKPEAEAVVSISNPKVVKDVVEAVRATELFDNAP